jgi:Tol biopolymer transport system component
MRHITASSVALSALLLVSPQRQAAPQASSSPIRKLAELDSTDVWGIAEPVSGRFVVFGSSRGIKVLDRRSRTVTPIIDSTVAMTPTWFGGSVSLSASGQRLVFFGADETRRKSFVWLVDLDTMNGKPVSAPHRVSLMPALEASISDDGRSIEVVTGNDPLPGAVPVRKLLIIPSAGGDERMLDSAGRIQAPRWTPDGQTIYYIRGRGNGPALTRVSASGGQPDSLAPAAGLVGVSPDGRRVAYYPQGAGDPVAVMVADVQGRRLGRSKMLDNDLFRSWSRSQPNTLLGSRDFDPKTLETVSLDNGKISPYPVNDAFAINPRFSPNGRLVAAPSIVDDRWQIVLIDASTKQRRVLRTDAEPDQGSLQWSPDGSHIGFLALDTSMTRHDLYALDIATSRATRLADMGPARPSNRGLFRWRSDGRSIEYVTGTAAHGGGAPTLERVTLSGEHSVIRKLPSVPQGGATDGGYRLLNDSLIAIGRDFPKVPTDSQYLAVIDSRTGATRAFVNRFAYWNMHSNASVLSPDGKWVAFGSGGQKEGKPHPEWAITSLDGKTVRLLGEPMMCDAWPEHWLPDSRAFLAVGVSSCDQYHIEHYIVPIDGGPVRHLTVPDDYGMTLTPDGRALLVATFGRRSVSLIALDVNKAIGGGPVQPGSSRKPGKN